MWWHWLIGIAVIVCPVYVLAWALCKAAASADIHIDVSDMNE